MSESTRESLPVGTAADEGLATVSPGDSRRLRRARREAAEAVLARGFTGPAPRTANSRAERFGVVFSDPADRWPHF